MRFINLWQSAEHRKEKYYLVLSMGGTYAQAERMRDWRLNKIERFFNLPLTPASIMHEAKNGAILNM